MKLSPQVLFEDGLSKKTSKKLSDACCCDCYCRRWMICHWRWWRLCWWERSWCYVRFAYVFDGCSPNPGSVSVMLLLYWPPCVGSGARLWLAGQSHPLLNGSGISWGNCSNVFPVSTTVLVQTGISVCAWDWNNVFQHLWMRVESMMQRETSGQSNLT